MSEATNKELEQQEKEDKVLELVEVFAVSQQLVGKNVEVKKADYHDGAFKIKVTQNERYDFLEIKYGSVQINVKFSLYPGEDDVLIERIKKLAEEDKDDWDRFWIDEENNNYGAIFIGYDQFEEMFPRIHSSY